MQRNHEVFRDIFLNKQKSSLRKIYKLSSKIKKSLKDTEN
jgi:hypothetical protein